MRLPHFHFLKPMNFHIDSVTRATQIESRCTEIENETKYVCVVRSKTMEKMKKKKHKNKYANGNHHTNVNKLRSLVMC